MLAPVSRRSLALRGLIDDPSGALTLLEGGKGAVGGVPVVDLIPIKKGVSLLFNLNVI